MKEIRIEARGRVQGVNFRSSAKSYADRLELKGFVMNKEDGDVSIIAQGKKKNLEDFLSYIQKSPGFSKIGGLSYRWVEIGKEYPDFRIIRENNIFLDKAKSLINLGKSFIGIKGKVPMHVAIIPDGNRRWAKSKGFEESFGHYKAGAYENLEELFKEGKKLGIKYMSIWGFSTENWKRSDKEKEGIFELILSGVEKFMKDAGENQIRFRHIGRKDRLPAGLVSALKKLEKETEKYDKFNVQLCLDYGGRDEIIRAVNKALKAGAKSVDEKSFLGFLDTEGISDPDLIIRTAGERRLSGFMPFQAVYSEFYFSDLYFPDFGARELRRAVRDYGKRQRRFGGNGK